MNLLMRSSCVVAFCALVLSGCATPQDALDQANNGAALTAALQAELREFRRVQANVAKGRIESIRRQTTLLATYDADAAFEARVQKAAGRDDQLKLYNTLRDLADSRAKDESDLQAKLAQFDSIYAKLLSPLPDPDNMLNTAQETLGVLGEQLSFQERAKMAADFAKTVKSTIDENKKKAGAAAAAAEAGAPGSKVQTAAQKPQ
jgi:hypothetical protein